MTGDDWYGELYLEATAGLLTPGLSAAEGAILAALLDLRPGERVLDAGCGTGRHLAALRERGLALAGVDRSGASLRLAAGLERPPAPGSGAGWAPGGAGPWLVRADLRALPFRAAFDAAYSWYSSLFLFDEEGNARALGELARAVRPGGRLLVQHANPLALAREPRARARRELPGGGAVEEVASFDAARGRERLERRLERPGRVLAGACELRYYSPREWPELARACGLAVRRLAGSARGGRPEPFGEDSIDLIAVLEKPT